MSTSAAKNLAACRKIIARLEQRIKDLEEAAQVQKAPTIQITSLNTNNMRNMCYELLRIADALDVGGATYEKGGMMIHGDGKTGLMHIQADLYIQSVRSH